MFNERSRDLPIIERKLQARELHLPNGVRKHIRRLKENGQFEEAVRFRQESVIKKMRPRKQLENTINSNLRDLIVSESPQIQAVSALKLTWILNAIGEIDDSEREADLYTIHRNWPEQSELLKNDTPIVFEVANLVNRVNNS